MAKSLPPLAKSVVVGSTAYAAGSVPPLKDARRITNKRNWEGGEVPDFDNGGYEDGPDTEDGVGNGDARNYGRTGLPGFAQADPSQTGSADATGASALSGDGRGDAANAERNNDPEGTGVPGAGESEGSDPGKAADTGTPPAATEGTDGTTDSPTGDEVPATGTGTLAARKRTSPKASSNG